MNCFYRLVCAGAVAASASVFAAPAPFPTSGTCGFVGTFSYPFAYQYGWNAGPGWGVTALGTMDWGARTMALNVVQINPAASASTEQEVQISGSFSVASGPIPGSGILTANFGGGLTLAFNALSVAKGTSVLLQTGPGPAGSADGGFVSDCKF